MAGLEAIRREGGLSARRAASSAGTALRVRRAALVAEVAEGVEEAEEGAEEAGVLAEEGDAEGEAPLPRCSSRLRWQEESRARRGGPPTSLWPPPHLLPRCRQRRLL